MKKSGFGEKRIITILREQQAGVAASNICRRRGVSNASFSVKQKAWYDS
jgi:putative transposase